ncbi:hypothetical protein PAMP_021023 [Pampus punctatissimus]
MSTITIVALLVFLVTPKGMCVGDPGVILRCQCISLEKNPIGRHIKSVDVHPPNSHCKYVEIIATIKTKGEKICLDPNAPWVKKVLKRKLVKPTT